MITFRPALERGHADHGWLDTRHSFSFADYLDRDHMGYSVLRVINEDRVAPGAGFPPHPHRDMEIVSWVLEGALEHRDSMGNGSVIRPGEVQRMSAGTGVVHSEGNASRTAPVHFLQIWILPERRDLPPGYEQKGVPEPDPHTGWSLVAARDGRLGSVTIHQDAALYIARLGPGGSARLDLAPGRNAWVQVARGAADVNGVQLAAGDGARLEGESAVTVVAPAGGEVLLFDLP